MATFATNFAVAGGLNTVGLKSINVAIHIGCGVLLFYLARGLFAIALPRLREDDLVLYALLAAALWLLAPLHVSTVLYTVQRMAQLSTLFALGALLLFVRYRSQWARAGASVADIIAAVLWLGLLVLLSVLSKENGILALWLMAVIEVTLFRGRWAGRESAPVRGLGWLALLAPLALFLLLLALSPGIFVSGYASRDFSLEERLLTQPRLLWRYLGWMVWPDINSMGFQHDDIPLSRGWLQPWTTLPALLGWLGALAVAGVLRRRTPLLLFALLFFLVGHFMESGVWPLEMVYEHRNYLPSVGVFIALAAVIVQLGYRVAPSGIAVPVLALVAISSTLLFLRVYTWSDGLRLAEVNVQNHPESSRSHFFLAESLLEEARQIETGDEVSPTRQAALLRARSEFELMHQLNPRDIAALVMLYSMDQSHFPALQDYADWLARIEELARDRPLQASDRSALVALVDCFDKAVCEAEPGRLVRLFETLQARYPRSAHLEGLAIRVMQLEGAPQDAVIARLEQAAQRHPRSEYLSRQLITEYAAAGDMPGLYETVRRWMRHDILRRQLSALRKMFARSGVESDAQPG